MVNSPPLPHSLQRVVFLLMPNVNLLDLAGSAQVFSTAAHMGAPFLYRTSCMKCLMETKGGVGPE